MSCVQVHELRALHKELVGRLRSLRFFEKVRDLQKGERDTMRAHTPKGLADVPVEKLGLLSCCGHMGEIQYLHELAEKQECPAAGCTAAARDTNIVPARDLGTDSSVVGGSFGSKLTAVVQKIKSIPSDERILVFVQFADLMKKVEEALNENGIETLKIKGSSHQMTNAMEKFQRETIGPDDERVLLLELHNESASGANLTTANHAIFVHPLHVGSLYKYIACETQAIGRIRRYGQKKKVHLWRYLAKDTIDTQIYDDRSKAQAKLEADRRDRARRGSV